MSDRQMAPAALRTVTVSEAFAQAQLLQRNERLGEAESIYDDILAQIPGEPNAIHFLGILRHQQGDADGALRLLRKAAELMPTEAGPWINLGNVLIENRRYADAIDAYRSAIERAPAVVQPYNNLGILHTRCQQWEAAEACFEAGLKLAPEVAYLHFNYSHMLHACGRLREAAAHGLQSLEIDPTSATARKLLSMSYHLLGENDKAVAVLEQWRALEPDNPEVAHHLAACGAAEVPERASDAYVEAVFDRFADSFDRKLQGLGYQAPQHVHAAVERLAGRLAPAAAILDVGCGTGLCGALMRPLAATLDGVDLSAGMLAQARQRGVYDSLHQGELTAYLRARLDAYDVVVSADTLCYFGELSGFLEAAQRALHRGGALVFSLEAEFDDAARFVLQVHGRYTHSASYVRAALVSAGLRLESLEQRVLRHEFNDPVQGWIVVAAPEHASVAAHLHKELDAAHPRTPS